MTKEILGEFHTERCKETLRGAISEMTLLKTR
jgi:hypothetical protein